MRQLTPIRDARILGPGNHYDDAVVIRVNEHVTLVHTVDFFTPVVDDPYWYGRIAAANSLSDVYAMGGQPFSAMNIVCFPTRSLGPDLLSEILRGGQEALQLAGAALAGGHTVEDPEPKFGLAVTGTILPEQVTYKGGLQVGQKLWLTKPIGSGILTTAHKRDLVSAEVLQEAIEWMAQLNDLTSQVMVEEGCRGCTDITGYGLLGHAMEMARASQAHLVIESEQVPLMREAAQLRQAGAYPGGSSANRAWVEGSGLLEWGPQVSELLKDLLCDAQTSGGLLLGLGPDFGDNCRQRGRQAWCIGEVRAGSAGISVI